MRNVIKHRKSNIHTKSTFLNVILCNYGERKIYVCAPNYRRNRYKNRKVISYCLFEMKPDADCF